MPDKAEVLRVTIKRNDKDPKKCDVVPPFKAKRDSIVTFDAPPGTRLKFVPGEPPLHKTEISPFDEDEFEPAKKGDRVKSKAREGPYQFSVTWPEASGDVVGNGTGEVIGR